MVERVLFIGDIVSKAGRRGTQFMLQKLRKQVKIDLVIANVENSAGGFGINRKVFQEIKAMGVDVMTTGNHIWDNKEAVELLAKEPELLRPHNLEPTAPGSGVWFSSSREVAVVNLQGRVFMDTPFDPFWVMRSLLDNELKDIPIIIVDFHAEATAEKAALAYWLDGRVTAVIGTHTHVQTNDARLLPRGTFFITDVGACMSLHSIIGMRTDKIIDSIFQPWVHRMEPAKSFPYIFNAIILELRDNRVYSWQVINELISENILKTGSVTDKDEIS